MPPNPLDEIRATLQRLSDIEAIRQVKARYIRLADAKEWDAWGKEVFTHDCQLETEEVGITEGRENVVATVSQAMAGAKTVHRVYTPEITFTDPDTASAIFPLYYYTTWVSASGPMAARGYGYYHETYVRMADGWRLKRSKRIRQSADVRPAPPEG
jgi:hypothetical protein